MTSAAMPIVEGATAEKETAGGSPSLDRRGWYGPGLVVGAFVTRRAYEHWRSGLPGELVKRESNPIIVSGVALLPNGISVAEFVQTRCIFRQPAGWAKYDERQRKRWKLRADREIRFKAFCADHRELSPSVESTYAAYAAFDAVFLSENKLAASKSALCAARRVLCERREIPRRGRPKGAGKRELHPRARHLIEQFFLHLQGRPSDVFRKVVAFAWKEHFPAPSEDQVREFIDGLDKGTKIAARKGERALYSISPKGRRPRQAMKGAWSIDNRTADFFAQRPGDGGRIIHFRPYQVTVFQPQTRKILAIVYGVTVNTETAAAAIREAVLEDGVGRWFQIDNGNEFNFLVNDTGLATTLRAFGINVHRVPAYEPSAKPVESVHNVDKNEKDRFVASFCGGQIFEKPEDAEKYAKKFPHTLPTLGDCNAWARKLKEIHNASPCPALQGLSPNLFAELHGEDRILVGPDCLDIYFSPIVDTRIVGNDGVRLDNVLYRPEVAQLAKLQGRKVAVRTDPTLADRVVLCDVNDGTAICHAYAERLMGATLEHSRVARNRRNEYKSICRKAIPARDKKLLSNTGMILDVQRDYVKAEEARIRAELEISEQRETRFARPDLEASAKKIKAAERSRLVRPRRVKDASGASNGFAIIAADAGEETLSGANASTARPRIDLADLYGGEVADDAATGRGIGFEELYPEAAG